MSTTWENVDQKRFIEDLIDPAFESQLKEAFISAAHVLDVQSFPELFAAYRDELLQDSHVAPSSFYASEDVWFKPNWDIYITRSMRFVALSLHSHDFFEINICLDGAVSYETLEGTRELCEGEAILTPPGAIHRLIVSDESSLVANIGIRKSSFLSAFRDIWETSKPASIYFRDVLLSGKGSVLALKTSSLSEDRQLVYLIARKLNEQDAYAPQSCRSLVQALLLGLLASANIEELGEVDREMEAMRAYLKAHLSDATLTHLAQEFSYSPSYLSRKWKSYFGLNFNKALSALRLAEAEALLRGTNSTISEIARSVGYQQDSYFIRQFKAEYGTTPHQYRLKT